MYVTQSFHIISASGHQKVQVYISVCAHICVFVDDMCVSAECVWSVLQHAGCRFAACLTFWFEWFSKHSGLSASNVTTNSGLLPSMQKGLCRATTSSFLSLQPVHSSYSSLHLKCLIKQLDQYELNNFSGQIICLSNYTGGINAIHPHNIPSINVLMMSWRILSNMPVQNLHLMKKFFHYFENW